MVLYKRREVVERSEATSPHYSFMNKRRAVAERALPLPPIRGEGEFVRMGEGRNARLRAFLLKN